MFVSLYLLSPGLILSGLYATKKSFLGFNFETLDKIGTKYVSVTPG